MSEAEQRAVTTGQGRPITIPAAPPPDVFESEDDRTHFPNPLKPLGRGLTQTGEMLWLFLLVAKEAVVRPRGYWGDVRDQMYSILRLCWVPMIISTFAFGFGAPGLQALNFFAIFGIPERLGSFFIMASVREFAPWINAMVVAGRGRHRHHRRPRRPAHPGGDRRHGGAGRRSRSGRSSCPGWWPSSS